MRIYLIHKEILKELAFTFVLSLVSLNLILIMEKILKLSRLLSVVGASFSDMVRIIFYLQPSMLILTLPMSLLVSTLLVYGRMDADNELVILRTSGMSFRSIAAPVFVMGISCFVIGIIVSFYLGPKSMIKMRETLSDVITQRAPAAVEEGVFNTLFKDIVLIVKEKPDSKTMREIFIYDERNKKEPRVLTAREGSISAANEFGLAFYLKDGFMHIAKGNTSTEIFFEGYNLSLNLAAEQPSVKNNELTPLELISKSKKPLPAKNRISLFLELHKRFSLPTVCLIFMLLGTPLSLLAGKSGRLAGLTIGLLIFVAFYSLLIYGENLARTGKIPHYIGAWLPTAALSFFGIWIFRRENLK